MESVLDRLACRQGRRDEIPNQELALQLIAAEDQQGIQVIAYNLWNKDKAVRADCIKVLYEIGYRKPELVTSYWAEYLKLLKSRDNRMIWGAMITLATIAPLVAGSLYPHAPEIQAAMQRGSVITVDAGVQTLAALAASQSERRETLLPFLFNHLRTCRPKDVPQHSEKTLPAVDAGHKAEFIAILEKRLEDLQGAQLTRVRRVIKQAEKL